MFFKILKQFLKQKISETWGFSWKIGVIFLGIGASLTIFFAVVYGIGWYVHKMFPGWDLVTSTMANPNLTRTSERIMTIGGLILSATVILFIIVSLIITTIKWLMSNWETAKHKVMYKD